ncbi:hypothetical protein J6590_053893 [Homalodisca vitripennis]|nr:hypothetical protein J6590_053893 [Homalodisca vitripennis]
MGFDAIVDMIRGDVCGGRRGLMSSFPPAYVSITRMMRGVDCGRRRGLMSSFAGAYVSISQSPGTRHLQSDHQPAWFAEMHAAEGVD